MFTQFRSALRFLVIGSCGLVFATILLAQSSGAAGTEDESTRLMQEYMAKRAEWVALRAREMERAKHAKETKARSAILKKLDDDERVLRAASAELAARLKAALEAKKNNGGAPRN